MPLLGAHLSIAGGYHKAVESAAALGMDVVQVFTKNCSQWRAKEISPDERDRFVQALERLRVAHPLSHSSYLINLAAPEKALWKKSIDALVIELLRAHQLQIPYVVVHPGSYTSGTETRGLKRIVAGLDEVFGQTRACTTGCLLETTAGQGTSLGHRFEHLGTILSASRYPERLGICFDTCHVFAAGYPLRSRKEYRATKRAFDQIVGLDQIKAFHLNDSQRPLGSRIDRHAHIGSGQMGLPPFRLLLGDRRFRKTPMYLETPKGTHDGRDWDAINLETLRGLAARRIDLGAS